MKAKRYYLKQSTKGLLILYPFVGKKKGNNIMKKYELYKEGKIKLTKEEIENYKWSEERHEQNAKTFKKMLTIIKIPYYVLFKLPYWLIKKVTFKDIRDHQQKEINRLKLVMESKARAREIMKYENVIDWDNKYLISDGIFNIGIDANSNIVCLDFNLFANLLIGGLPGGGKSKLIQLIAFQCLKNGATIHICDFKGGLDTQKFENKCNIITKHTELLGILEYFKKQINSRIELFKKVGAENLKEYNQITGKQLKREYLFIDELGEALEIDVDGMSVKEEKQLSKDIEKLLRKLARLGRALGLNIIAGTQRPDVTVLEGQTRSQFGCRVCFQADKATSKIVIQTEKADELPEIPGRAIIKKRNNYINLQVFKFNLDSLKEINNKIAINENKNTKVGKEVETVEIDLD